MDLMDVVRRASPPAPWAEGEKIPWHEPAFSRRMLVEHLSQDHDLASRRTERVEEHVRWIHDDLLRGEPVPILDVGCGPGLYASRLARLGHACLGIDIAPASIEHARQQAKLESLDCRYVLGDARDADLGRNHGLGMFLFGEINVFRPEDARALLRRVREALAPDGRLVLEPHTFDVVEQAGRAGPRFSTHASGLFSAAPYLQLEEAFWDAESNTATTRWWIVDAGSGEVTRHAQTMQAYDENGYERLLDSAGFAEVCFHPALGGGTGIGTDGLLAITARPARSA